MTAANTYPCAPAQFDVGNGYALKQFVSSDGPELLDVIMANSDYLESAFDPKMFNTTVADKACRLFQDVNEAGRGALYKIVRGGVPPMPDTMVGVVDLRRVSDTTGILSYWRAESSDLRGIASRASAKVVEFALNGWGLDTIMIHIAPDNIPSQKVAAKLGAVRAGILENPGTGDVQTLELWRIDKDGQ